MRVPREQSGGQETAPVEASRYFDKGCRPTTVAFAKSLSKRGSLRSDFKSSSVANEWSIVIASVYGVAEIVEGFVPVPGADGRAGETVPEVNTASRAA